MGSRQRRSGADKSKEGADRKMIETIQEATGATEGDIRVMLEECNFDANETTSRLIDNPFSQVQSRKDRKKKRDEDRKKEPTSKVMEIRRNSSSGGRGRGHDRERGQRGDRGSERGTDRGFRPQANVNTTTTLPPLTSEKQLQSVQDDSSGWEVIGTGDLEPQTDRPIASSGGWGEIGSKAPGQGSAQQPIGKPTLPAPIRPPGGQHTKGKSMADLFKEPSKAESGHPTPLQRPQAPSSSATAQHHGDSTLYPAQESEANGWGTHGLEPDNSRQSSSLGGVAIEAPKKLGGSQQPIQAGGSSAGTSGLFSSQTPVGSLGNAPASPQRTKLEESSSSNAWGVPSSTATGSGLGGLPVDAPPRQHSQLEQPQRSTFTPSEQAPSASTTWAPKSSTSAGGQSLGGSILNSIQPQPGPAHASASEGLPLSSPRALQQPSLGNSHSAFGQSPMVIPSPNQTSKDLNSATIQFGGFSLGNTGQDLGGFKSPAFPSAFERNPSSQAELPATLGPSASEPFKPSYSHIPPTSLAQAQQQKAYNAFTSAGQPQTQTLGAGQRASNAYAPETSTSSASSHPLYGQGYQSYGTGTGTGGQSFNQYQPSAHQQAYQNYNSYQAPSEAESKPTAGTTGQATSQPAPASSVKSGLSYDPSHSVPSSYPQYPSHHTSTGTKDYQPSAAKYSSSSHLPAAPGPVSGHNLAQVVNQTPLTVPAGYGNSQGSSLQQGYGGYGGQQGYGNNSYQQYNNYVGSGYGGYNQRTANPYQQQPSGYGQGAKGYGGGSYGAGGGYQHGGGYGAGSHKSDKDHLVSHMGGHHNLYGQQQLPLSGQSHFQGGLPSNNQGYGNYSNSNQGYSNYGMGNNRQYSNQY